jgi:hypothetical protein
MKDHASYLNGINSEEQDNDSFSEPLTLRCIMGYTATVREVIEQCSELLQLGLGNCEVSKGPESL